MLGCLWSRMQTSASDANHGKQAVMVYHRTWCAVCTAVIVCHHLQVVMCDEAHFLKNSDAQITQAVAGLPARRRLLMSGEVAAHQSSALWC